MSNKFRELLKKVGSGTHTSENLTRLEAATATKMMLLGEATPAQIGAFMMSHRIKRPSGEELAGMLDAYDELGSKLQAISTSRTAIVLGIPYDGRTRTAPVSPLTAILLATAGQPVVMHGGERLPTKYGLSLLEIWQGLNVNWASLPLDKIQKVFEETGIAFVIQPQHFPLTKSIWEYRDQLGKRPPFATMELIWCPYAGNAHIIAGYVHPPTEGMFQSAFAYRGVTQFTTIKGLEGSCDLPRERTAIIGLSMGKKTDETGLPSIERLSLNARDYGFTSKNAALGTKEELLVSVNGVLEGKNSELMETSVWNGGFYLWRCGICSNISEGIKKAEELFTNGAAAKKLDEICQAVDFLAIK